MVYIDDGSEDPRGNWKDDHFGPLKGRCFHIARVSSEDAHHRDGKLESREKTQNEGIRGAIRYRQWKLHTGIGSKKDEDTKSGWEKAPGREDGFVAFDDDYEDMTGPYT